MVTTALAIYRDCIGDVFTQHLVHIEHVKVDATKLIKKMKKPTY